MVRPRRNILIIASIALLLWVIPSLGTQGMGTIGQRNSHADSAVIGSDGGSTSPELLRRADATVKRAVLAAR